MMEDHMTVVAVRFVLNRELWQFHQLRNDSGAILWRQHSFHLRNDVSVQRHTKLRACVWVWVCVCVCVCVCVADSHYAEHTLQLLVVLLNNASKTQASADSHFTLKPTAQTYYHPSRDSSRTKSKYFRYQ